MKEQVIQYFEAIGKFKITFNPAIKIQYTPHSYPVWIDDMSKVNDNYIITVSTKDDDCKKNLNDLTDAEMQSLNIRLYDMATKAK